MQEYAIAGSYVEFMAWRGEDREARGGVIFIDTPERAAGREKGTLHRVGAWEESPARQAAEELEA